jgi:hypothetical protein
MKRSNASTAGPGNGKREKVITDIDALAKKHGLIYDNDDNLVITQSQINSGVFDAEAVRSNQLRAEEFKQKKEKEKEKEKEVTRIAAPKLKRICSANLNNTEHARLEISKAEIERAEEKKRKDMIYNLMTNNTSDGLTLLTQFAELGYRKLLEEDFYPHDPKRADDAKIWDSTFRNLLQSPDSLEKRAFIWMALYMSPKFVDIFCPRGGGTDEGGGERAAKYLTDAKLLTFFLKNDNSPFVNVFEAMLKPANTESTFSRLFASSIVPLYDFESFAINATMEWVRMQPWRDMDTWLATDPNLPSIELRMLLAPSTVHADIKRIHDQYYLKDKVDDADADPHENHFITVENTTEDE